MSSLRVKLTVALLFTALAGIIIIAVLVQQITTSEFDTFIIEQAKAEFLADVTAYYEVVGSWEGVESLQQFPPAPPDWPPPEGGAAATPVVNLALDPAARKPNREAVPIPFVLFDVDGTLVLSDRDYRPDRKPPELNIDKAEPVVVDGETVGYVMQVQDPFGRDKTEQDFLRPHSLIVALDGLK